MQSMKSLKFSGDLIPLVICGDKNTTWRINDEKNLSSGEIISLKDHFGKEFGKAEILDVRETTFGKLDVRDKEGHEMFSSDEDMLKIYSGYYGFQVSLETSLKVIRFRLLDGN